MQAAVAVVLPQGTGQEKSKGSLCRYTAYLGGK